MIQKDNPCPICNTSMKQNSWSGTWGLEEEYITCEDGCKLYAYGFAYGSTRFHVDDLEIGFHYTSSQEERNEVLKNVDEKIKLLKQTIVDDTPNQ